MSVQTVFQSAITGRPPCIKLSFYFCAEAETRPISVSVRARFMGETSSSRSSSQLSTWFMATWAISRPAPQSSPSDELVPSARVTAVCFLRRTIFIHANKLNLPCFCGSYFLPPPTPVLISPRMTSCATITRDVRLTPMKKPLRTVWDVFFFLPPRRRYE